MNLLKKIASLAALSTVIAGATAFVLKKKKEEKETEENVIYSSTKVFNDSSDIEVSLNEDQQVEVVFMDTTGTGKIDAIVSNPEEEGKIDVLLQETTNVELVVEETPTEQAE